MKMEFTADALLVIDMQKGLHSPEYPLYHVDEVIETINQRIDLYVLADKPIIFVQHHDDYLQMGSEAWELFAELHHQALAHTIDKTHPNAFYQTVLQSLLNDLNIQALEISGAQTEYCVDTTVRFAHGLGYTLSMAQGAHTTTDSELLGASQIIGHHSRIWKDRFLTFIAK